MDFVVNCKQTEIARHSEGPEQAFKKFIEQEEERRGSRIMARARRIFGSLDPLEFETFIKMTTPRIENREKMALHERNESSNFLLSNHSKPKIRQEGEAKRARKEIFIAPTEVCDYFPFWLSK